MMVVGLPKKSIEELIALYTCEPNLADVYTEGEGDQAIIEWFLHGVFGSDVNIGVYPIDTVEIPTSLLEKHKFTRGNRSEVIALLLELQSSFGHDFTNVTGVIDRDMLGLIDESWACPLVLITDQSCLELYYCCEKTLTKAIALAFRKVSKPAGSVLSEVLPIVTELFLIRTANCSLKLQLTWQDHSSFVSATEPLVFRREEFLVRYLAANRAASKRPALEVEIERLRQRICGTGGCYVNGHDLLKVLEASFKRSYSKPKDIERLRPHSLGHTLCCCMDGNQLATYPMFNQLRSRVQSSLV